MDIHESFEYNLKRLNEVMEKINAKSKEGQDLSDPYVSQWDHFESFLIDLISDRTGRYRYAILRLFFNDEELDFHEKVKELSNILSECYDKKITSMVYESGFDEVSVEFDKVEDKTSDE